MGRRGSNFSAGGGEDSAMDMMSALIGCLILILIGILLIIMVSQALIVIVQPDEEQIEAVVVSNVDTPFREVNQFGNLIKEPWYFDVTKKSITIFPGGLTMPSNELRSPGNIVMKKIQQVRAEKERDYIILIIRPDGVNIARKLQKIIYEDFNIDLGTEVLESDAQISFSNSDTRDLRDEQDAGIVRDSLSGKPVQAKPPAGAPAASGEEAP